MKRRERVAAELTRSLATLDLVEIDRRHLDALEGYVVDIGSEWVLIANVDSVRLDGYIAVRRSEIRRLRRPSNGPFVRRYLELQGQWPPAQPSSGIDLSGVSGLLISVLEHEPIIAVHPEYDAPEHAYVGAPVRVGARSLYLQEITPRACWTHRVARHRLDGLTRIDFQGEYEKALLQVGGPPPDPSDSAG